jgi:single-strand DNA-binding protein
MLQVTLLGNMGKDPETRFTQKGTQIVSFSVAVNQVRTGPDGERQENTEWFRIKVSGRQGEFVQRLTKGTKVLVMGRLDIGHYQSRDGETKTSFDVWADEVQAMSARTFGGETEPMDVEGEAAEPALAGVSSLSATGSARPNGKTARPNSTNPANAEPKADELEDLPF